MSLSIRSLIKWSNSKINGINRFKIPDLTNTVKIRRKSVSYQEKLLSSVKELLEENLPTTKAISEERNDNDAFETRETENIVLQPKVTGDEVPADGDLHLDSQDSIQEFLSYLGSLLQ